jgi:hypothetical protein
VWLALAVPCVAVIVALGALALFTYRDELAAQGKGDTVVERGILRHLTNWQNATPALTPVVMFGDSLTICAAPLIGATDRVSLELNKSINASGQLVSVFDLGQPGLRPLHFYALLDEVLAKPVGLMVIEINPHAFVDPRLQPGAERLPQLSRKLALRQAVRVRPALALDGLSLFDPFIARLKEQLGLLYVFEGLRQIVFDRLAAIGLAANKLLGLHPRLPDSTAEVTKRLSETYLIDYANHPTTVVLRAMAEDLHAAKVPFFFYVAPLDVSLNSQTGQYERTALVERLDALRRSIGASEAEWLDLHDAIRDSSLFRDRQNHLKLAGCPIVGRLLARRAVHLLAHARDQQSTGEPGGASGS